MNSARGGSHGFNPLLIAGLVLVGVVAFIALWALVALGPQLSSGNDGGGHALSKAAPGFAAIVDLAERAGADVELRRHVDSASSEEPGPLLILTPKHESRPEEIAELLNRQDDRVLIVLPKWQTLRIPGRTPKPGWVSFGIPIAPSSALIPEAPLGKVDIRTPDAKAQRVAADVGGRRFSAYLPEDAQVVDGDGIEPLIAGANGGAVLARAKDRDIYILADPDLIDNLAFASRNRARAAAMLIDAVAEDAAADGFAFDLTLNGFGGQRSLLRFAFVPPFIGITLCLIAAGLLALWQAWVRFGPALKPGRAIPVSKAALIANSADLVRQARRELDGADAYVASQRSAIARRLHAPTGIDAQATDAWIDRRLKAGSDLFSALARRLPLARNKHEFLEGAQALSDIRKELLRDG
ncbi:DUF4350 domain-containing protein [Sphingopyxis sp.]|uniref:DUF4350 domain-containing protein n=1 Tax=Sphingopyxis sp. TaxID=1908224 RepID=UPI0026168E05|nr:DUF4350 domain-containing protein [Sphingopyxis sp.]MCW0197240.1 DUF4350 domain-containing protein [Sphingopyxis sp.]